MLSSTAKYAVRALVRLAQQPEGAVLGRELAELTGVPANYLSKILLTLKRAGLVDATRGLGGGYRLHRPTGDVTLAEIVDLFDSGEERDGCLLSQGQCSEDHPCPAHRRWCRVKEVYRDFLAGTTLAEISQAEVGT